MPGERTGAPKRLQDKGPRRSRPTENPPSRAGYAPGSTDALPGHSRVGHASGSHDAPPSQSRAGHASGSSPDPNPPRVMHTVSETARSLESSFRLLESGIQSLQQQVDDERVARVAGDDRLQRKIERITAQPNRRSEVDELRRETRELRARVEQLVAERSAVEMSASQRTTRPSSQPLTSQRSSGHVSDSQEAPLPNVHPWANWEMRTRMRRRGRRTRIDLVNRNPEGAQNNFVADDGLGEDGVIGKTSYPDLVAEELARMKRSTGCDAFIFTAQPVYFDAGQEHPGVGAAPLGEPRLIRMGADDEEDRED
ncbi:hypothetical protein CEP54_007061 [Fusarium duplospermum]|uniref:Uncharacterized protein n=1 Tax=Fusarium duplospermum TaxID=1325734 RepID=A0A428Q3Q9_9HYPO|nr:hypothetical protein CEP54_007061 [Fusarium duplospermum]